MSTAPEHRPLTFHDLDETPDDGNRYEVIDGVLYVSPFPSYPHQHAVDQLVFLLTTFVREHNLGRVHSGGLKVVLDVPTGVGPDVVFISTARLVDMREDGFHGVPDLLVEVVSSKPALDRIVKFGTYAAAGVPHYWIVDPKDRRIDEFVLTGGRYARGATATEGRFTPNTPLGFSLDATELWLP